MALGSCRYPASASSSARAPTRVRVHGKADPPLGSSYDGWMTEQAQAGRPGRRSYPKGVRRRQQILDSAIALLAQRGMDRTSLRTMGEAIGVSHTALRHYFSSRDELLVEAYRAHEARAAADTPPTDESAVGLIMEAAERNRSIPGLVELYATLTTDALQEQHGLTRLCRPGPGAATGTGRARIPWLQRAAPAARRW